MMEYLDQIPVADPQIISKYVDGEMILLHPAQGKVRVLNAVGSYIWEMVDGSHTIRDISQLMVAKFDVDQIRAENDVTSFMQLLNETGLIHLITLNQ